MLRSATFDTYVSNCTSVEQILDLCARCLYNRYYSSGFLTTGIDGDGVAIRTRRINHWTGTQTILENEAEEQTITSFVTPIGINHKQSSTPWLEVLPVGDPSDTPNGSFA